MNIPYLLFVRAQKEAKKPFNVVIKYFGTNRFLPKMNILRTWQWLPERSPDAEGGVCVCKHTEPEAGRPLTDCISAET